MLVHACLDTLRHSPDRVAVSDRGRSLTSKQLRHLACALRSVVDRETNCPRVGIMLPASSVFPAGLLGILWSSRIAIPLNFLLNATELSTIVGDAAIDLLLTTRHFAELAGKLPVRALFLEDLPLKRLAFYSMLRRDPPAPEVNANDTAVILYTSGTAAEPKGVELTHNNLYSNCVDSAYALDIRTEQRFLNILPPFHVFGLTANVLMPMVHGCGVYAIPRFSPMAVVKAVAAERVSIITAIPSMYAAMLRLKSATSDALRSVELAISGGEPLPDSVRIGFEEKFGVSLRQGYGLTETSPVVAAGSVTVYRHGTVGKPIRNVEVRVMGEDGHELPPGQDGELWIRGPGVMKGYYNKPTETAEVINGEGWFRTGDIGRLDRDGFLSITGRAKEMLIIGGENVFPREIESVLESHAAVLQAAVIGIADESRGEAPVAFVIPKPGRNISESELRHYTRNALAGFKVPKQVHIREDLPTGPTGKILKRRLPELLTSND